jgi:hypothetical protein
MAERTVQTRDYSYVFSSDGFAAIERQTWGLVRARIVDELTGDPPDTALAITTSFPNVLPRVATFGLVGLAGAPIAAFPHLATQSYAVPITLQAEGYISRPQTVTIPMTPGFPGAFGVTDIGDMPMHRLPVVLRGRVVLVNGIGTAAISGATVSVEGLWRTLPPANVSVPPDPPNIVSLRPALSADRAAALGSLRRRNIVPVLGQDKQLLDAAAPGSVTVRLSDRVGLAAGRILQIDPMDPDRREISRIAAVDDTSAVDRAAVVTLEQPLALEHRSGVLAQRANLTPAGPNNTFAQDALAGDTCVFLNAMSGLNTASVVEVLGGPGPNEFHDAALFTVTSDVNGYYRLPPISRVAQLLLRAADGVHVAATPTYCPDYDAPENRLNFSLR